jgi:flagellar L-ring protein precursor FlgH
MNRQSWFHYNQLVVGGLVVMVSVTPLLADSLVKETGTRSMFADKRAAAVGDLVTILVQENNSASKDASTKTSKSSSIDMAIASFLYGPSASGLLTKGGQYPALKVKGSTDFSGTGAVGSNEQITSRIAVRVVDVLPNRNLVIEGSRHTAFSGEKQDVVLRGVVRPDDITANNTVYSYNVADVTIRFVSSGAATDGQKKGWFTKVWDKVNPF